MESYKHLYAKKVVFDWLKTNEGAGCKVLPEYPIAVDRAQTILGMKPTWDQWKWPGWTIPTYAQLKDAGLQPLVIADLAVIFDGQVQHMHEIVHMHDMSGCKIEMLITIAKQAKSLICVFAYDAEWVLRQTGVPDRIERREWMFGPEGQYAYSDLRSPT